MLQNILHSAPYLTLLLGISHLFGAYLMKEDRAKVYSRIARFWLLISLFFAILFYEYSFAPIFFSGNAYTLLFILIINILGYHILGLSVSWFSAQNRTGGKFDMLLLSLIIFLELFLFANNLLSLFLCYSAICLIEYFLFAEKGSFTSDTINFILWIPFGCSVGYLFYLSHGHLNYTELKTFLPDYKSSYLVFLAVIALILPFFYSLGIAPLHITTEDRLSKSILPVSHCFAVILPLAFWGAFIKLNILFYNVYADVLMQAYLVFALASIIFGALGANARLNLQRLYAYSSCYHFGLILLLLSLGHKHTDFAAFIYLFSYLLSLNGAYLVFYSLKSHDEYLFSITGLSGLAETRSYAAGALSISLFSLVGMPPLIGFLGMFNLYYEMIKAEYFISLGVVFIFLLLLFKAYLELIKTAYFEHKMRIFDNLNRLVLLYMFLNVCIIVVLLFNPFHLIEHMKDMFYVIFL